MPARDLPAEPRPTIRGKAEAEISEQDIDAGFAKMSKRFHEGGGAIYLPVVE